MKIRKFTCGFFCGINFAFYGMNNSISICMIAKYEELRKINNTMEKYYNRLFAVLLLSFGLNTAHAFNDSLAETDPTESQFSKEMKGLNTELMQWDMVRGEWMAQNLVNVAYSKPLTERPFEDEYTVAEFVDFIPDERRRKIQKIIETKVAPSNQNSATYDKWLLMERTFGKVACPARTGRTYGDPHLSTFDGERYSFQTVGEFVLAKSTRTNFEVQTRQKASSSEVSLNIAAAMNVNGDRVAFYTNEYPDNNRFEPVRVNGNVTYIKATAFSLPNGGIIRKNSSKKYIVTWPTGEKVMVDLRRSGSFDFLNVNVEVPTCNSGEYRGLLGNANGNQADDLTLDGGRNVAFRAPQNDVFGGLSEAQRVQEKEYLRFIANEFGNVYRVNNVTSLFDYGIGQTTMTFTDLAFPRVHRSISDLPRGRRDRARRRCIDRGVSADNMNACVFDVAYIDIAPEPQRRIPRATEGVVLKPTRPTNGGRTPGSNPNGTVDGDVNGGNTNPIRTVDGNDNTKQPELVPAGNNKPAVITNEEKLPTPEKEVKPNRQPQTIKAPSNPVVKEPVRQIEYKKPTKPVVRPSKEPVKKPRYEPKPQPKPTVQPRKPVRTNPKPRYKAPAPKPRVRKPVTKPTPTVRRPTPKPSPSVRKPSSKPTPSRTAPKTRTRPSSSPKPGARRIGR